MVADRWTSSIWTFQKSFDKVQLNDLSTHRCQSQNGPDNRGTQVEDRDHVSYKKSQLLMYRVRWTSADINTELLRPFFQTYIFPILDYGAIIWCYNFQKIAQLSRQFGWESKEPTKTGTCPSKTGVEAQQFDERHRDLDLYETYRSIYDVYNIPELSNLYLLATIYHLQGHSMKMRNMQNLATTYSIFAGFVNETKYQNNSLFSFFIIFIR